jgi:hypothetical protein
MVKYINNSNLNEQTAWDGIMHAANQAATYYRWCHTVLAAHEAGQISQTEAAGMMCPREDMAAKFGQLEKSADVQIVMDYAADIFDGAAYIGAARNLERDWKYIVEVVNRHF